MSIKYVCLKAKYPSWPHRIDPVLGVIHHTASFGNCSNFLADPSKSGPKYNKQQSAHFMIHTNGTVYVYTNLIQLSSTETDFKPWAMRANHAGESKFVLKGETLYSLNNFAIGIELTGDGNQKPYTDPQLMSLYEICIRLTRAFPNLNNPNRWVGHQHITPPAGGWPRPKGWTEQFHPLYSRTAEELKSNNAFYCNQRTRKSDPGKLFDWKRFYEHVF